MTNPIVKKFLQEIIVGKFEFTSTYREGALAAYEAAITDDAKADAVFPVDVNESGQPVTIYGSTSLISPRLSIQIRQADKDVIGVLIRCGQKIEAIKHLRRITNWNLKDSKDCVEDAAQFQQYSTLRLLCAHIKS